LLIDTPARLFCESTLAEECLYVLDWIQGCDASVSVCSLTEIFGGYEMSRWIGRMARPINSPTNFNSRINLNVFFVLSDDGKELSFQLPVNVNAGFR
jgi:hypothetical protein